MDAHLNHDANSPRTHVALSRGKVGYVWSKVSPSQETRLLMTGGLQENLSGPHGKSQAEWFDGAGLGHRVVVSHETIRFTLHIDIKQHRGLEQGNYDVKDLMVDHNQTVDNVDGKTSPHVQSKLIYIPNTI
uniref:Uncharacterized protein n=1 Tax=Timema genevievae TaxID=629358 RepID=A0A7R9PJQ1_TIMGE|nr:unnamed protein product [Timema genevievae]